MSNGLRHCPIMLCDFPKAPLKLLPRSLSQRHTILLRCPKAVETQTTLTHPIPPPPPLRSPLSYQPPLLMPRPFCYQKPRLPALQGPPRWVMTRSPPNPTHSEQAVMKLGPLADGSRECARRRGAVLPILRRDTYRAYHNLLTPGNPLVQYLLLRLPHSRRAILNQDIPSPNGHQP